MMQDIALFLYWLLTPSYSDYTSNPGLFWVQVTVSGIVYGIVALGIIAPIAIYLEDGEL